MEEEDGPEDCSSKLLSIPFVEVFRSTFCSNDVFALNKVSEEIILNEVSLGKSPTSYPDALAFLDFKLSVSHLFMNYYSELCGPAPV